MISMKDMKLSRTFLMVNIMAITIIYLLLCECVSLEVLRYEANNWNVHTILKLMISWNYPEVELKYDLQQKSTI